jgi:ubiquinone/menaquinone biosynthesis C-methylase UbiE
MDRHTEQAIARFNDWSATYGEDRISPWFNHYQALAMSKLNIEKGSGFLDVGCGTGWAVRQAIRRLRSGRACGIDIAPKMVAKAIALSPCIDNVEFLPGNSEAIPYPDDTFSSILCTSSFHHYQNPVRALCEMKRVMKSSGTLVILDAARDISWAIWLQDRWRRHLERSHVRYYTTIEMRALVAEARLTLMDDILTLKAFMDHKKLFTGLMLLQCTK